MIKPSRGIAVFGLSGLWRYRELFYFLALRDIKVRYKQTVLGIAWVIINPIMQMLVWAFVFGKIAKLPSGGIPYVLITLTGTLAWNYFSEIVNNSGSSLINNSNLITKIYFPRLIIPLSVPLRALLDLVISFILFLVLMLYFKIKFSVTLFFLPVFVILATLSACGIALWVAAMSIKYRDVAKITPYFLQAAFFLTPVAYLTGIVPLKYQWIYFFNPMSGVIDGLRWCTLGLNILWPQVAIQFIIACFLFVSGIIYFRNLERTFADII